jgi:hypothetical protein
MWKMVQLPKEDLVEDTADGETELNVLHLSKAAVTGLEVPRTMKFMGHISGLDALVLLDSGSSHSFISTTVAQSLPNVTTISKPFQVQVANGFQLQCTQQVIGACWSISGVSFSSTLNVLPLPTYDIIIGMDWLEAHSPMWIHWAHKWLCIPLWNSTVMLRGIQTSVMQTALIQVCSIQDLSDKEQSILKGLPDDIQQLLHQYSIVFEVPQGMPPVRDCDHKVPLLPGARPVQMRPYRYAPALKTEIEQQVTDMLKTRIIQPSQSEFASSVILVKKKDNTYRFCVDYRHLNALTVKTKFLVPIIDEFLDELS